MYRAQPVTEVQPLITRSVLNGGARFTNDSRRCTYRDSDGAKWYAVYYNFITVRVTSSEVVRVTDSEVVRVTDSKVVRVTKLIIVRAACGLLPPT